VELESGEGGTAADALVVPKGKEKASSKVVSLVNHRPRKEAVGTQAEMRIQLPLQNNRAMMVDMR